MSRAKDEARIVGAFEKYKAAAIPVWMIMFPEGTRFTPAKHEVSRAFATKAGLVPLRHLLIPRTKGFSTAVTGLRATLRRSIALRSATQEKFRR